MARTRARFLTFSVVLFMGLMVFSPALSALAFTDVRSGHTPYARAIMDLESKGIVEGYVDGSFRPSSTINRAEFLKIVLESQGGSGVPASFTSSGGCFSDVRNEWFAPYVCTAKTKGIVEGYPDGTFKPERTINFVEASKILSIAFGQDVQGYAEDWYEPYVLALESSKAIPPSVSALDANVTRGEMAEMMWRLTDNVTDQPAKGYLNVKYPSLEVNLASDTPQKATSCGDLQAFAQEPGMLYRWGIMLEEMAPMPSRAKGEQETAFPGGATQDYSQTNVQVEGVDESDIVKVDGTYLYAVRDSTIRVVRANPPDALTLLSTINLSDSSVTPSEIYLDGDQLIVLGSGWREQPISLLQRIMPGYYPYYPLSIPRTEVRIYDISDRADPILERTLNFDGSIISSRRIGGRVYLVMNQGINWIPGPIPLEEDIMPMVRDSLRGGGEKPIARCSDVTILPHVLQPEYLIVAVVPTRSQDEVKSEVLLGSAENIYASTQSLYVSANQWRYSWGPVFRPASEQTLLYRFAFTPAGVEFKAQGSVPGHILNQFSMDEHASHFRVATTSQKVDVTRGSVNTNNLYILNADLERIGAIEDIAPDEQIYSVRFMGDRAYMVTFKKTDPFFVIDVSDGYHPKILGKLKIPGFSDYLHPYDENHIIGFGKEAVDAKEGDFAWYQGMKIALFDVTDPSNPLEMDRVVIGDRGTSSPLLNNHKALLFDRERNLLAFPISVAKISDAQKSQGSWDFPAYGDTVFQGAYVYDISLEDGIEQRGSITHYGADDVLKAGSYLYGKDIERIVRIEDSLYTVGQDGVMSSNEQTVEEEGKLQW